MTTQQPQIPASQGSVELSQNSKGETTVTVKVYQPPSWSEITDADKLEEVMREMADIAVETHFHTAAKHQINGGKVAGDPDEKIAARWVKRKNDSQAVENEVREARKAREKVGNGHGPA